jgi:alkylhydroperoxidase family enzyme
MAEPNAEHGPPSRAPVIAEHGPPPRVPVIAVAPDAEIERIFEGAKELLAFVSNFARTIAHEPSIARWAIPMIASIQRGGSDAALDPRLKELVILKTSTRNRCFF